MARLPARCFRVVHRKIGITQDFERIASFVGPHRCYTDTGADTGVICSGTATFVRYQYRFLKRFVQPVHEFLEFGPRYGRGQQRHKFVAPDAPDHVVGAQLSTETLAGNLKDGVTGVMSERVVDALEFIHVDEK